MDIIITQPELKAIVSGFNKVINKRTHLPVLHHVHIQPGPEGLVQLTATNLEETLTYNLTGAYGQFDSFLFPFSELKVAAKDMKRDDRLALGSPKDGFIPITAVVNDNSLFKNVPVPPVSEWPVCRKQIPTTMRKLGEFLAAYQKALPFVSTDPVRYVLNCVFFHHAEQVVVGTDGRRLARFSISSSPFEQDVIIPATKVLKNGMLNVELGGLGVLTEDDTNTIEINTAVWSYQARCPEGIYPNYMQVIPEDNGFNGTLTIHPDDLGLIKAAVAQLCSDEAEAVVLFADGDVVALLSTCVGEDGQRGRVILSSSAAEMQSPVANVVNGQFLLDALKAGFDTFRLSEEPRPWLCTGSAEGLHVLMPMRTDVAAGDLAPLIHGTKPEGENTVSAQQTIEAAGTNEQQQTDTGNTTQHNPNLTLDDPVQELMDAVIGAQEAVKQANSALHGIKGKLKAVEKHYRARDKQFAKSEKVLAQLQEVVNF